MNFCVKNKDSAQMVAQIIKITSLWYKTKGQCLKLSVWCLSENIINILRKKTKIWAKNEDF